MITGPCWPWRFAEGAPELSVTRAATPTRITAIAATSDTATIFRWVARSAGTSEWFMGFALPGPEQSVVADRAFRFIRATQISSLKFQLTVTHRHADVPAEAA